MKGIVERFQLNDSTKNRRSKKYRSCGRAHKNFDLVYAKVVKESTTNLS